MHTAFIKASPLTQEPRCTLKFDILSRDKPCLWMWGIDSWQHTTSRPDKHPSMVLFTTSCCTPHVQFRPALPFVSAWSTLRDRVLTFEREIELDKPLHTTTAITMSPAQYHHRAQLPALEMPRASQHLLPVWQIHQSTRQFHPEQDHPPALGVPVTFALLQCRVLDMSAPISMVAHALGHPVQDTEEAQEDLCLRHPCSLVQLRLPRRV
jgi:hypothetical protein